MQVSGTERPACVTIARWSTKEARDVEGLGPRAGSEPLPKGGFWDGPSRHMSPDIRGKVSV